jgi:hypothetical protein
MIEFGCTLNIVAAIDLNTEWRRLCNYPAGFSNNWYNNYLGCHYHPHYHLYLDWPIPNTYLWPSPGYHFTYLD